MAVAELHCGPGCKREARSGFEIDVCPEYADFLVAGVPLLCHCMDSCRLFHVVPGKVCAQSDDVSGSKGRLRTRAALAVASDDSRITTQHLQILTGSGQLRNKVTGGEQEKYYEYLE